MCLRVLLQCFLYAIRLYSPFLWVAGSAIMNWYGAGFLGMVINTPTINYFTHGTQLIMPHGHAAMFGAFGFIAIAFIYMTARANAMAEGHEWSNSLGTAGFWLSTLGIIGFGIPKLILGFKCHFFALFLLLNISHS